MANIYKKLWQSKAEVDKEKFEMVKALQNSFFAMKKSIAADTGSIRINDQETDEQRAVVVEGIKKNSKSVSICIKAKIDYELDVKNLNEILASKVVPHLGFGEALKAKKANRPNVYKLVTDATLKSDLCKKEYKSDYQCVLDVEALVLKSENLLKDGDISEMFTQVDPTQRFFCPIYKTLMIEPQLNTVCGHKYSKKGIFTILKKNGAEAKCPFPGCNKPLREENLILDEELVADIAEYKKSQLGFGGSSSAAGRKRMREKDNGGEVIDDNDDDDAL
jgi:hypothetical protein